MDYGLNFFKPVDRLLEETGRRGFTAARIDVQDLASVEARVAAVASVQIVAQRPIVIVESAGQVDGLPLQLDLELGNELDGDIAPQEYAANVIPFVEACVAGGHRPWIGAISNLDRDSIEWLKTVINGLPPDVLEKVGVTYHWYAHGQNPETPHPGFRSRDHEFEAFLGVIRGRPHACSEFGFSTAPHKYNGWQSLLSWFGARWSWSDADVDRMVRAEWRRHERWGNDFAVLYQITDGPNALEIEHRFGIRRVGQDAERHGEWKPVADSVPAHSRAARARYT